MNQLHSVSAFTFQAKGRQFESPGRSSISLNLNQFENRPSPRSTAQEADSRVLRGTRTCCFYQFRDLFEEYCRAFVRQNANGHESISLILGLIAKSGAGVDPGISGLTTWPGPSSFRFLDQCFGEIIS
jgi:hypothetical protein